MHYGDRRLVKPLTTCTSMNITTGPRQYSVAEAANHLKLHPRTVYELIAAKQIQSRRKGPRKGRIFFLDADLDAYLSNTLTGRVRP